MRALMNTLAIRPPLVIDEDEIEALFDCLARALDMTQGWLSKQD